MKKPLTGEDLTMNFKRLQKIRTYRELSKEELIELVLKLENKVVNLSTSLEMLSKKKKS